ncbi:MAG: glycosyltransferase [Lachnospiraceae bacterium]|nr:glycosyltransferase [Lachnospiraceae bacterium]
MTEPLVSCIITSYKREQEIVVRAVTSVINQTYLNTEILIIDDNRGEGAARYSDALEALKAFSEKITVYPAENGHGAQKARNTGIRHARGEYIAFLDDDDEWLPDKLEKQLDLLIKKPETAMCYCNGFLVKETGAGSDTYQIWEQGQFRETVTYADMLEQDYIGSTSQAVIRKAAFEVCGMFDESLPARQDYEMWIRLSRSFSLSGVSRPLYRHYLSREGDQISRKWRLCMEGHDIIYRKYREDIEKSRAARFNIVFHRAHYYMMGMQEQGFSCAIRAFFWYIGAFFTSPKHFLEQWKIKVRDSRRGK